MVYLATEQQLIQIVNDYVYRFPLTEDGDAQLLQGRYDYMGAFFQTRDRQLIKSRIGLHLLAISCFFRFAKWMERLA